MKFKNKTGISLIVLVITIVIMIILATTIIISLTNNGIIDKANEAVFATNVRNYAEELNLYLANKFADNYKYNTKSLNADSTTTPSITDIITTMKEEDKTKFKIIAGTLFYIGDNEEELSSCENTGVKTKNSDLTETEYNEIYKEEIATALLYGNVVDGKYSLKEEYSGYYGGCMPKEITTLAVPFGVTEISGFFGSQYLEEVILPDTLLSIASDTFEYCYSLNFPKIPKSVTKIGNNAFDGVVKGMETITIWANLSGDYGAFDHSITGLSGVKHVIFEDGITEVKAGFFSHCNSVQTVTFPEGMLKVGGFFYNPIKELYLPESVTTIETEGFVDIDITTLTIPKNVTSIGDRAFWCCYELKTVYIESTKFSDATAIGSDVFLNIADDAVIYVRNATVASYLEGKVGSATISTDYNWTAPTK